MTSHRLTANEKVTELDTPIAGAAILPGALLLGVLLTGPSRLALVPLGGGRPHIVDLHLDSPQDVALLSPDVALVRTGDGAVWTLANLTGEPRPKVTARDVRSLHARPGGGHALGIGEGGSATAFSIARGEVSARTFAARGGALRTADVDEHVTYVIAEGEVSGVFRIHPGATPELGTSARAQLPAEAAALDRVRGSASLAVVFKRGETSVAVITGGPRRFDAKQVSLGAKVADAAVIGSSLAVVFIDGRAALYDEATIAGAGSAVVNPASELALGTRGRPRVLLAASIKGAPTLWVGTTSGELVSIAVSAAEAPAAELPREATAEIEAPTPVEEAPAIEAEAPAIEAPLPEEVIAFASLVAEPAPPAEAEPEAPPVVNLSAKIAEFEHDLAGLRQALATVEAAGARERLDAADDRARVIAELEAARDQYRAEAAADKARAMTEIEAARWKDRADAAEDKARALAVIEAAREKDRADAEADKARAIAAIDAEREQDRADAVEDKARAIAEAAERAGRELAATVRAEREEGELALSDRGRALDAAKNLALRTLEEEHAAALARVEHSHELALASRDEAIAAMKRSFEEEQQAMTTELERLRDEATRHKAEVAARKAEIDRLEDALHRERERAVAAERAGEGVINVERAREKLGGVLDRVRSELQKRR